MNNFKLTIPTIFFILFSTLQVSLVFAENEPEKKNLIEEFDNGFSVPESPAFTALNVTPQKISRPNSPKDLAVGLLEGADRNGNLQTGIAIDTAPFLLGAGKDFTIEKYRNSWGSRALARIQVSIATTKGATDDDNSAKLALGFRFTPYDEGDPRLDTGLTGCYDTAFTNTFTPANALSTESYAANGFKVRGLRSHTEEDSIVTIEFNEKSKYGDKNKRIQFLVLEKNKFGGKKGKKIEYKLTPVKKKNDPINLTISDSEYLVAIKNDRASVLTFPKNESGIRLFYDATASKAKQDEETKNFNPKSFGEECRKASRIRNAHKSAWTIGVAPTWISPDGATDNLEWAGGSIWSSFSYGFDGIDILEIEKPSLFIIHARYNFDEQIANDSVQGSFLTQETLSAGGRLRFAATDTLYINAEGLYNYADISGQDSDVSTEYSLGVDVKIPQFQGTWLELSMGGTSGKEVQSTDDTFLMGKLKWDFSTTGPSYDNKKWKEQSKK